ncbi:MAG: ammonium transporter [Actinomycetota bacterium]|nr:ammonium transporter [Actinomycetota bacterium]
MQRKLIAGLVFTALTTMVMASPAFAFDLPAEPDTQYILDNIFVFFAAVLVLFMQAGFALVEAGLTRAKSVANIMMKNLMDMAAGILAFAAIGFTIAYGPDGNDFFGLGGWFLNPAGFDESSLTLGTNFLFQVAFAATAATIVSGAMAERTKFKAYFLFSLAMTAFIYPVVVRWMWGGGWLSQLDVPFGDFAGSTIVHSVGGWAALMGAIILGPRLGKYGSDGKPRAIPGHSIPFVVLGVFILFIGWFGFNPGSELAADLAVGDIAVTTIIAAAAGAVAATATIWIRSGYPDVGMAGNGLLAGLVSITAGCGALDNWGALAAGLIGGVVVVLAVQLFERSGVDDPVGAISVHGVCGAWGTLAVGLFATKSDGFVATEDAGLFYGGGLGQLGTQAIGVLAVFVFVTITSGLVFLAIKATIGLRVSPEEEVDGLDVLEHGAPGYGADTVTTVDTAARTPMPASSKA